MSSNVSKGTTEIPTETVLGETPLKSCKVCSAPVPPPKTGGSGGAAKKKYCSVGCRLVNQTDKAKRSAAAVVEKYCLQCGLLFSTKFSRKKYCGAVCQQLYLRDHSWCTVPMLLDMRIDR